METIDSQPHPGERRPGPAEDRPEPSESQGSQPPRLRVDLHTHTIHSPDATIRPAELVRRSAEAGLHRIAVTDHGTIEGALEARELAPGRVIVGEEIRCRCGTELIGLFLSERIPMRLPVEEVVERIRDQRGIVYAPHPYAYAWRPWRRAARALGVADLVEGFNSRAFFPPWNRAARRSARRLGLPVGAGSDAHFLAEVGRAYTEMPAFTGPAEFLAAVRRGRPVGLSMTSPAAHLRSAGLKLVRRTAELAPRIAPCPVPSTLAAER